MATESVQQVEALQAKPGTGDTAANAQDLSAHVGTLMHSENNPRSTPGATGANLNGFPDLQLADAVAPPFYRPETVASVLSEVHTVENSFLRPLGTGSSEDLQRQKALTQALSDSQHFCQEHPDQAAKLISGLESQDLIGQLAIAALEKSVKIKEAAGQKIGSLSENEAIALINEPGPLGEALQKHLVAAFSVTPDANHFGTGYADAVRDTKGGEYWGASESSDQAPVITRQHLDELMTRFDHGPAYSAANQPQSESFVDRLWDKITSAF